MSQHLTLRQAARELEISLSTLRRAVAAEELQAIRAPGPHGERWLVSRTELLRYAGKSGLVLSGAVEPVQVIVEPVPAAGPVHISPGAVQGPLHPPRPQGAALSSEPVHGTCSGCRNEATVGHGADEPVRAEPVHPDVRLALEVAAKTLDQNRELLEHREIIEAQLLAEREQAAEARERAARAERQAEELRYVLTQHQRALTEAAESLAEERARAMAAELAAAIPQLAIESREVSSDDDTRFLRTGRATRPGWGSRLRRWLLGERTG